MNKVMGCYSPDFITLYNYFMLLAEFLLVEESGHWESLLARNHGQSLISEGSLQLISSKKAEPSDIQKQENEFSQSE